MTSFPRDRKAQHRRPRSWHVSVGLVVALTVVSYVLTVARPTGPPLPPGASGPSRLANVWPGARVQTLDSASPDGSLYTPLVFIDRTTSVGLVTSGDATTNRLVIRTRDAVMRDLRTLRGPLQPTIAAVTVAGDRVYWIEAGADGNGRRLASVWRADVRTATVRRLAIDPSEVVFFNSAYDLQISDGRVHWAAVATGVAGGGEIHSVPVEGGPVNIRRLDKPYALTAWPWATSAANGQPGPVELLNLSTGESHTVPAGPSEILTCSPSWCRVTTLVNQGQDLNVEVERIDGRDRRRVGHTALMPLNPDVALVDRFEVLAGTASANASAAAQRLWLYDLTTSTAVLLADAASTGFGARGGFVWWSTGDNETAVWHVLDLRDLR